MKTIYINLESIIRSLISKKASDFHIDAMRVQMYHVYSPSSNFFSWR